MSKLLIRLVSASSCVLLGIAPALGFEVPEPSAPESEQEPAPQLGDDLDLFAVLDTFKNSEDVEDFERRINDPDAGIANLDLNEDEEIDFIGVFEEGDGDVHVLILRAFLGEDESQDLATIELERRGEDVTIQVVGNPALYGPDYLVEPDLGEEASLPTRLVLQPTIEPVVIATADSNWWPAFDRAGDEGAFDLAAVVVVRTWPTVRVIYVSGYSYYRSSYYWRSYPTYYRARRPVARSHYRHRNAHYRERHRQTTHRSSTRASSVYKNNSSTSPRVQQRSAAGNRSTNATPSPNVNSAPRPTPTNTQSRPQNSGGSPRAVPSGGGGRGRSGGGRGRRR